MRAAPVSAARDVVHAVGRVVDTPRRGVVEVETPDGPRTATLGAALLVRLARSPRSAPRVGDLVELTCWPDGPVTVDRVVAPSRRAGVVTPLRRG